MRPVLHGLLFTFATVTYGQQDPQFTQYLFNSLVLNPAYAGSREHLAATAVYRQQWLGVEGAPVTQTLTAHTPLRDERVAVGLSLVNDKIGVAGTFDASAVYAYRFPIGKNLRLAAGLQAGVTNWRGNWSELSLENPNDIVFQENIGRWLPNFGLGVYLDHPKYYIGIGCPRVLEHDLRKAGGSSYPFYAQTYRHFYLSAGAALPLGGENAVFRPTLLLKSTDWLSGLRRDQAFIQVGAPTALDLGAAFVFAQAWWVGAAWRTSMAGKRSSDDSADLWFAWSLRNGLRLGAAYDIPLSDLGASSGGSFEVMVGYEFDWFNHRAVSPRYF